MKAVYDQDFYWSRIYVMLKKTLNSIVDESINKQTINQVTLIIATSIESIRLLKWRDQKS